MKLVENSSSNDELRIKDFMLKALRIYTDFKG